MSNYAIGAVLVADLRAEARRQRGSFSTPDPGWYDWMAERLYRTGREVESKILVERFLGRPISTTALLADLERSARKIASPSAAQRRLVSSTSAK
jgi:Zn-dependent M32 family carboxypeptidase